ncbi:formate/nitrite transporter family protein, partial [Enterococcus faecalis]|uniref:formate/nitrite transporter family protein n=1 Tax=Enterococcus faecalis TaxID=1351 RepID=UPI003CC68421
PADLASVHALVGAAVFPIGLIVILMAGGELITGIMMAVSTAWFAKKVSFRDFLVNWVTNTLANIVGALFVSYFFGHYLG